ncbi:universal stress protein [Hymenobacter caeli]|uniref:Nucleotide-binding universal stress UspA family protein n=1 Tax=Hymenobacter caeli TaxID=2735894 RepID=A0ABX2FQY4_9BACT|nr:universal stress protein [Hymenobacter caeli]NRT19590.1 nucleotide-binding universal stress UspA family protein [Hymenobacter caeli]
MNASILVLANFAEAAEPTARYAAALGAPLHLRLALLHLEAYPVMLEPELVAAAAEQTQRNEAETMAGLHALARRLPGHPEVLEAAGIVCDGVAEAVRQQRPLLLAMGLNPEQSLLDRLLVEQVLPVLRATHRPLLLVPRGAPCVGPPRRVLVAVDGEPFTPNAASLALAPLLAAWSAAFTVAHVRARQEQRGQAPGRLALADVRASGLLPAATPLELHEEAAPNPATGVLQAVADTRADLLVLMARPRSFLGELFHRSVTASVLRHCAVPVLLLPAEPRD